MFSMHASEVHKLSLYFGHLISYDASWGENTSAQFSNYMCCINLFLCLFIAPFLILFIVRGLNQSTVPDSGY